METENTKMDLSVRNLGVSHKFPFQAYNLLVDIFQRYVSFEPKGCYVPNKRIKVSVLEKLENLENSGETNHLNLAPHC